MADGYARTKAKDLFMDANIMNPRNAFANKLSVGKIDEQRTNFGSIVHNVDESRSRAYEKQILNTVAGNISRLSASIGSQVDVELFRIIKASFDLFGLGSPGSCVGMNDSQSTIQIVENSVFSSLHLTKSLKRLQAKQELFKRTEKEKRHLHLSCQHFSLN